MDNDVAIKVKGVSKVFKLPHEKNTSVKSALVNFRRRGYEIQQALDNVSFEIKKGEFFGIVGRNGSGKSTLLKLLAGIYTPTKGSIKINGSLVPFIELGVGFNPELTGRENVFLNGALLGISRKQMTTMYDDIVKFAELERFMDQKLKNYSSGMQVRLAFSIAIRAQGDILLLDEVLAVGDSSFQRKCLNYFREVKQSHKTVVLVTHSMSTVEEYCDRALMLEDSKIIALGSPMKISAQYEMANSVFAKKTVDQKKKADHKRPPTPSVRIKKVQVSSPEKKTSEFNLSDDVQVEVELEVKKKQNFALSLVLQNMDGEYIAGYNTRKDIPSLVLSAGEHKLLCRIAAGQFPIGVYRLTINVTTNEEHPEIIDVASSDFGVKMPMIIFSEKSLYKKGKFYMNATWQLKK
jgi:ABC-2 type transport system ATP-binding protein